MILLLLILNEQIPDIEISEIYFKRSIWTWISHEYNIVILSVLGIQLIGKQREVVVYIRTNSVLVWSAGCNTTAAITSHSTTQIISACQFKCALKLVDLLDYQRVFVQTTNVLRNNLMN